MTERLHFHFSFSCIGEGNGNPLQCSCLENPRNGGAWWAAIYGVAQSRTRLKWLSSSSSIPKYPYKLLKPLTSPFSVLSHPSHSPFQLGWVETVCWPSFRFQKGSAHHDNSAYFLFSHSFSSTTLQVLSLHLQLNRVVSFWATSLPNFTKNICKVQHIYKNLFF